VQNAKTSVDLRQRNLVSKSMESQASVSSALQPPRTWRMAGDRETDAKLSAETLMCPTLRIFYCHSFTIIIISFPKCFLDDFHTPGSLLGFRDV
jgi:hypothetical protein